MHYHFSSQPKSVHGAGTVRHWAAVNVTIAQCRHNVSARDGGITASRKSGAGDFSCSRPSGPFPECATHNHAAHSSILPLIRLRTPPCIPPTTHLHPRTSCGGCPASLF